LIKIWDRSQNGFMPSGRVRIAHGATNQASTGPRGLPPVSRAAQGRNGLGVPACETTKPGPGAGDEEQAAFALDLLVLSRRVSDRMRMRHDALLHPDDGDGPELQALEPVHRADPDRPGRVDWSLLHQAPAALPYGAWTTWGELAARRAGPRRFFAS
jgi:hypothetical protein